MSTASQFCAERMERLSEHICKPSDLDELLKSHIFYVHKQSNGPDLKKYI